MINTVLILLSIWSISIIIMRKHIIEDGVPLWVSLLRLILVPLLLLAELIGRICIGIRSSLGN